MKVRLNERYLLTDEHSAASGDIPVLLDEKNEKVVGPSDQTRLYDHWPLMRANVAVWRRLAMGGFSLKQSNFIAKFTQATGG